MTKSAVLLNSDVGHGVPVPPTLTLFRSASMSIYRRLYEQHFGPIPKGYHIHHRDGDHSNNHITNLQCVSVQEHYDIHYSQGDYGACWAMHRTGHLTLSDEDRSNLVKKQMEDPTMKELLSETMKQKNEIFWANTEYREMQVNACKERFTLLWSDPQYKSKVSAKISASWCDERKNKQAKEMSVKVSEYNKVELTCPHCGKAGRGIGIMNRWHFDNCKKKEM